MAILIGHEENNPRLQMDEKLVQILIEVLKAATAVSAWETERGEGNYNRGRKGEDSD